MKAEKETDTARHERLDALVERRRIRSSTPPTTKAGEAELDFEDDEVTEIRDLVLERTRKMHDECMKRSRKSLERLEQTLSKLGV